MPLVPQGSGHGNGGEGRPRSVVSDASSGGAERAVQASRHAEEDGAVEAHRLLPAGHDHVGAVHAPQLVLCAPGLHNDERAILCRAKGGREGQEVADLNAEARVACLDAEAEAEDAKLRGRRRW